MLVTYGLVALILLITGLFIFTYVLEERSFKQAPTTIATMLMVVGSLMLVVH